MEEESYKKLSVEERCAHKLWKARLSGYEDVAKLFRQIDDEKSPEFGKYLGSVKKFVSDSNAVCQEKGLEAALAYVENYSAAGKTAGEVMSAIVGKCVAAPKTKTRELAVQIALTYVEIEKQDVVQEELLKGTESKNPKIVAACVNVCTLALREFGSKVFPVKPLVKKIALLFADRDKAVRDEARLLVVEMYRWVGPAIKPQLASLQQVQLVELETEFAKIEGQKAVPTRYLRSQQVKRAAQMVEEAVIGDGDDDCADDANPAATDPLDLVDPVDILSKLPKDFYDRLEMKKWQDRKEALDALETLLRAAPKLENGDYGNVVRALKKVVQKDTNVVVVTVAARCLAGLATGLRKKFAAYSGVCVPALLEKFKERKQTVAVAIREAIDAVFLSTTIEAILEDVLEALNNKNPSVKSETALFLARSFTKILPVTLNKKLLKALTTGLIALLDQPDPTVRDSASEALGTLTKLVGEKAVSPFLVELEKDNLKMTKIKECCEKAVILVKVPTVKKEKPQAAVQPVRKPAEPAKAPPSSQTAALSSGTATIVKSKAVKPQKTLAAKKQPQRVERDLSDEEVDAAVFEILSTEIIKGLGDSNWKTRLSSCEQLSMKLKEMESGMIPTQAVVRLLVRKPGLKDTNFQVLKIRLDIIRYLAGTTSFSITTAYACLNDIIEKLGDIKNGVSAAEALTSIAEATSFNFIATQVMEFAVAQKSPKVFQEALNWISNGIREFGFSNLNSKLLVDTGKKGLASSNPAVRGSAITYMGTLYLYMGAILHQFLENEKPALKDQLHVEFDKYENEKPPSPTRGIAKSASAASLIDNQNDADDDTAVGGNQNQQAVADRLPRVDISPQITEQLINELADKNWKVRNEALVRATAIVADARLVRPNLGDLPPALALRLVDSNAKIAQTAMMLCEQIVTAMGPASRNLIRTLFPGLLQGLGGGKAHVREAALKTINAFGNECGYKEFFEGEMIVDALRTGSPALKSQLWAWFAEKFPTIPVKQIPKPELMQCVPFLFANLEDRNADVRKSAQDAVLGVMIHVGYQSMVKQCEKIKPASKAVVIAILDKARANVPVEVESPPEKRDSASSKGTKSKGKQQPAKGSSAPAAGKPKSASSGDRQSTAAANRKKDNDVDMSPLLVVNSMKQQRMLDESRMKVLKWNFSTPREEFYDLLKDQMTQANVNRTLIANMFHSDFRFHIKALEALTEDLEDNSAALISNLDLILKWLSLRFFDTNPSVLLKGIEYLHKVFDVLTEQKYRMVESEALAFIPYLVLKTGDPKDSVRNGIRTLFNQMGHIYPMNQLFSHIMEGIKSKNARQRSECLDTLGTFIEQLSCVVCHPSAGSCLREIAKQISDRDNAVRNAALNCIVQAYHYEGERVFKMIGQLPEKDLSLLQERIRRAPKKSNKPKAATVVEEVASLASGSSKTVLSSDSEKVAEEADAPPEDEDEEEDYNEEDDMPQATLPSQITSTTEAPIAGPFKLDPQFFRDADDFRRPAIDELPIQQFDLEFLKEEIVLPAQILGGLSEAARRGREPATSPDSTTFKRPPALTATAAVAATTAVADSGDSAVVRRLIDRLDWRDADAAAAAAEQLLDALKDGARARLLIPHDDRFHVAVAGGLARLSRMDAESKAVDLAQAYRLLITVVNAYYACPELGKSATADNLCNTLRQLLEQLINDQFSKFPESDQYYRVINLICVQIIENTNRTSILCAVIKLLHQSLLSDQPRLIDLAMKCQWRVIKMMLGWSDQVEYDKVLLEIHLFMRAFPPSWWAARDSDMPIRTVKTTLHRMAKMKGVALLQYLSRVPNADESQIEHYIMRYVRSVKMESLKPDSRQGHVAPQPLPRATHTLLTEIFQKIGTKGETKAGLNMLYDFRQQHPEADIEPYLKRSSKYFQEYIQTNLKEIENSRKCSPQLMKTEEPEEPANNLNFDVNNLNEIEEDRGLEYWKKRLEMWKSKFDHQDG